MSKVAITKSKLDYLANCVATKSGETIPLTIDEMADAVMGIQTGGTLITKSITQNGTYDAEDDNADGYSSVTVNVPAPSPTLQSKSKSYTPTETAQSETVTADNGYDGLSSVAVSVGAISSTYVGSGITRRSSSDLTASGATVTVPSGYYSAQASKAVASGTAGTPTATKGAVSNHSVSVTPSVTNTTGYITGSTINGTAVTVTASELASGNKAITQNGTDIDVVGYSTVSVDVQGGGLTAVTIFPSQSVTANTPDTSGYTIYLDSITEQLLDDANYIVTMDGEAYLCHAANIYGGSDVYAGDDNVIWGNPSNAIYPFVIGSYANNRTQWGVADNSAHTVKIERVISFDEAELITKTIVANGTYNASSDNADGYSSVTVNVPSSSPTIQSLTVAPSTTQQSFNSGSVDGYKPVTVAAVSQTNLSAENIKSGTTVTISNGTSNLWSVTGTYSGGGSSDVAMGTLTVASNVNTSTSTQITTTTAIGFTPTKFFFYKTARTATSNHVHQASFITLGSYYIRTMTRYSSNALSTSGNTNSWTTQTAGYLYFSNDTIYFRSSSSYILSSGTWNWVAVK